MGGRSATDASSQINVSGGQWESYRRAGIGEGNWHRLSCRLLRGGEATKVTDWYFFFGRMCSHRECNRPSSAVLCLIALAQVLEKPELLRQAHALEQILEPGVVAERVVDRIDFQ